MSNQKAAPTENSNEYYQAIKTHRASRTHILSVQLNFCYCCTRILIFIEVIHNFTVGTFPFFPF